MSSSNSCGGLRAELAEVVEARRLGGVQRPARIGLELHRVGACVGRDVDEPAGDVEITVVVGARFRDHVTRMAGADFAAPSLTFTLHLSYAISDRRRRPRPLRECRPRLLRRAPRPRPRGRRSTGTGNRRTTSSVVRNSAASIERPCTSTEYASCGAPRSNSAGRDRKRPGRRGRSARDHRVGERGGDRQHFDAPRARPRRRGDSGTARSISSTRPAVTERGMGQRARAHPLERIDGLVFGAGQQRAGPAHADAAHPRRPFHRAHALELRREPRHEREHAGVAGVARPDHLDDPVDAFRRRVPQRGDHLEGAVVGDVGQRPRSDRSRCRRRSVARASHTSGAYRSSSKVAQHLGACGVGVAVEVRDVRAGDAGRGDRAGEPGVGRILDLFEQDARAPSTIVELQPGAGLEEVAKVGAGRVLAHDLGPRLDLPRPVRAEQQPGDERGSRTRARTASVGAAARRARSSRALLRHGSRRATPRARGRTRRSPTARSPVNTCGSLPVLLAVVSWHLFDRQTRPTLKKRRSDRSRSTQASGRSRRSGLRTQGGAGIARRHPPGWMGHSAEGGA